MIAPEIEPVIVCALELVASNATITIKMVEQRRRLSMGTSS
jgi:hypothetical protein